jgi:hypothetical protein
MKIRHLIAATLTGFSAVAYGLPHVYGRGTDESYSSCFPFGHVRELRLDLQPPAVSRTEWWCPQEMFYGFLGFSYAFQYTNMDYDVAMISNDMARMKNDFGATMIRMYIPESYTTQLWENVIEAAILNNMGVVVQVAFPISGNDVCREIFPIYVQLLL